MSTSNPRNTIGLLGLALAGLSLSTSAFAIEPLSQGYMLAASKAAGEGKCGEGKCGASGAKASKTATTSKTAEGKCGEGKCGASEAKPSKAGATSKTAEGKCGEGKCGDASFAKTDSDDDGFVSKAEFIAVAPTRAGDFAKLDVSGDGKVSEKEAYDFLKATYEANGKTMPAGLFSHFGK
ncbi:EF-hand domain-containing protein [Lysobacter arvi]|uniref:EF-hand domain-containing protein n=1 Tax=Lysobacter arvi TaxID=3038776 RepID=A0ABU1CA40_9GAMM|nr:EF-hand domain-containing protein [Lysobacter arvi]MDR0182036.1 EF-hand domain-containing protein [Lysobacter arvi]